MGMYTWKVNRVSVIELVCVNISHILEERIEFKQIKVKAKLIEYNYENKLVS